jgi:hypothetical protein
LFVTTKTSFGAYFSFEEDWNERKLSVGNQVRFVKCVSVVAVNVNIPLKANSILKRGTLDSCI